MRIPRAYSSSAQEVSPLRLSGERLFELAIRPFVFKVHGFHPSSLAAAGDQRYELPGQLVDLSQSQEEAHTAIVTKHLLRLGLTLNDARAN
ncbi:UNVERIFIED_CONTAM: hypothetical protein FKN15_012160 [Acipenser sinensis]